MLRCAEHDLPEVIALLAKDIPNCFYMYVDISKYGLSNQNMNVNNSSQTNSNSMNFNSQNNATLEQLLMNSNFSDISQGIMRD